MNIFNQYELANHYYDLTDYIDKNIYKFKRNGKYLQENWLVGVGIVAGIGLLAWLVTWLIKKNKNKKDNKKNIADIKEKQDKLKQAKEKEKEKYEKASEEEKENMEADALVQEVVINSPETILNSGGESSSSSGGSSSQPQQQNTQGSSNGTLSTPQPANVPTGGNPSSSSNTPSINNPTPTQPKTQTITPKQQAITPNAKTKVTEVLNNLPSSKEKSTEIGTALGALKNAPKEHQEKVVQKSTEKINNPTPELKNIALKAKKVNEQKLQIETQQNAINNINEKLNNYANELEKFHDESNELYSLYLDKDHIGLGSLYNKTISILNSIEDKELIEDLDKLNNQLEAFSDKFNKIYYVFLQFVIKTLQIYEKYFQKTDIISALFTNIKYALHNLIAYYNHCVNNDFLDQDILSKFKLTENHTKFQSLLKTINENIQLSNNIYGCFYGSEPSENIDGTKIAETIETLKNKFDELNKNTNIKNKQDLQLLNDKFIKIFTDAISNCQVNLETIKTNISNRIRTINNELDIRIYLITEVNKKINKVEENNKDVGKVVEICTDFLITFLLACYIQEYNGRIKKHFYIKNENLIKLDGANGNLNLPKFPILKYDEYSKLFSLDLEDRPNEWKKILTPVFTSYEINEYEFSKSEPDSENNTIEDSWKHKNYNIQAILKNNNIKTFVNNINRMFSNDFKSQKQNKESIDLNNIIFHFFKTIDIDFLKNYKWDHSEIQKIYIDKNEFKIAKKGMNIYDFALKSLLPKSNDNIIDLDSFNNYIKDILKNENFIISYITNIVVVINGVARQNKIINQEINSKNINSIEYVKDQNKLNETENKNKEYLDKKKSENNNPNISK